MLGACLATADGSGPGAPWRGSRNPLVVTGPLAATDAAAGFLTPTPCLDAPPDLPPAPAVTAAAAGALLGSL